jgi:hypothetical protein
MPSIFFELPEELRYHVLGFLTDRDLVEFSSCSRSCNLMGKTVVNIRQRCFAAGLEEAAEKIGRWIEQSGIHFEGSTGEQMRRWLIARPRRCPRDSLGNEIRQTIERMDAIRDGLTSVDSLFFAQNKDGELPSAVDEITDVFDREKRVMSVFSCCISGVPIQEDSRVVFEAMILGLSRLQRLSDSPLPGACRSKVASRVFAISSIYARNIRGLDTDYDAVSQVCYELIVLGEMERVFTFLTGADASSSRERVARKVTLFLDELCRYQEGRIAEPIDPWYVDNPLSPQLSQKLRRRLTIHMNMLGYFFLPIERNGYLYWTGGREFRFRIECSWGFRYDTIRSYWLKGQTGKASECVRQLFRQKNEAKEKAIVFICLGFCLEMTLASMDRLRGAAGLMVGEATFEQYLDWLRELMSLVDQNECKEVAQAFLQEHAKIPHLTHEVRDRVQQVFVAYLEHETFYDVGLCQDCKKTKE